MTAATAMDLRQALDRSAAFFRDRETRCGVLARRVLGQPRRTDAALAEYLVRVRRCKTRMDGSAEGSFVRTAWTAWELLDLDCSADHAGVVRTLGYVIGRQNAPGHFAEGCDRTRHERRLCCHFLRGFFSPGPRDELLAPLTLPNGVTVDDEERARFGASCLALRVVLRAGEDRRPAVREHIDCLLGLARLWNEQEAEWSPGLASFALGGLALAPFEYRQGVAELAETVARRQEADGTWPAVDLFQAVEALLPVPGPAASTSIRRAAGHLCRIQRDTGAFDDQEHEERTLIGLRALARAIREEVTPATGARRARSTIPPPRYSPQR